MLLFAGPSGQAKEWPRFRGPNGSGISLAKGIPSKFTVADAKWRVALKGEGHSSPVLWECASPYYCFCLHLCLLLCLLCKP